MTHQPAPSGKAQFNVYLPRELIRRAKYACVDHGLSLSQLVDDALTAYLDDLEQQKGATSR